MPERARLVSLVAEVDGRIVGRVERGLDFFGGGGEQGLLERARRARRSRRRGIGSELYRARRRARPLARRRRASRRCSTRSTDGRRVRDARAAGRSSAPRRCRRSTRARSPTPPDADVELVPARAARPARPAPDRRGGDARHAVARADRRDPLRRVARVRLAQPALHARRQLRRRRRRASRGGLAPDSRTSSRAAPSTCSPARAASTAAAGSRSPSSSRRRAGPPSNGITQLVTTNDETNAPMLAINRRLGYRAGRPPRRVSSRAGTASSRARRAPVT